MPLLDVYHALRLSELVRKCSVNAVFAMGRRSIESVPRYVEVSGKYRMKLDSDSEQLGVKYHI